MPRRPNGHHLKCYRVLHENEIGPRGCSEPRQNLSVYLRRVLRGRGHGRGLLCQLSDQEVIWRGP